MKTGEASKNGKGRKMFRIQDRNSIDTLREEVTETTSKGLGRSSALQLNQTETKYHRWNGKQ